MNSNNPGHGRQNGNAKTLAAGASHRKAEEKERIKAININKANINKEKEKTERRIADEYRKEALQKLRQAMKQSESIRKKNDVLVNQMYQNNASRLKIQPVEEDEDDEDYDLAPAGKGGKFF